MSLRSCNEKIDLNRLLRKIIQVLGGSGGGHPKVAGAIILEKKIFLIFF